MLGVFTALMVAWAIGVLVKKDTENTPAAGIVLCVGILMSLLIGVDLIVLVLALSINLLWWTGNRQVGAVALACRAAVALILGAGALLLILGFATA